MGHPLIKQLWCTGLIGKRKILSYINLRKKRCRVINRWWCKETWRRFRWRIIHSTKLFQRNNKMRIFKKKFRPSRKPLSNNWRSNRYCKMIRCMVWVQDFDADAHEIYQVPRAIQAGRVWINQYHSYPAGAPLRIQTVWDRTRES
jgi:aldehyde dehydrogenase